MSRSIEEEIKDPRNVAVLRRFFLRAAADGDEFDQALERLAALEPHATAGPWVANGLCLDQTAKHPPEGNRLLYGECGDDCYSNLTEVDIEMIAVMRTIASYLVEGWRQRATATAVRVREKEIARLREIFLSNGWTEARPLVLQLRTPPWLLQHTRSTGTDPACFEGEVEVEQIVFETNPCLPLASWTRASLPVTLRLR